MYYILASHIQLVGFQKLPFAMFDFKNGKTDFVNRELFTLVYHCDGKHDIDIETLPDDQRQFFERFVQNGFAIPCEQGESLKPHQEYRYFDNRFKETAHWSITGRCNYKCKHCFMSAPDAVFGHASTEQCLEIIRQLAECGVRTVSITGGEPLVREDFMELVDALTEHGIVIASILTNGALVNDALLDGLEARKQHPTFQMSYDGKGWHDWLRGIDGAEEKVLDAFRLLQKRGYNTSSAMALHRGNLHTLRDTVNQLAEAGCSGLKVNVAFPQGEWKKHPEHFLSMEEGYKAYLEYIPQYFDDGAPISVMLDGTFNYIPGASTYQIVVDKKGRPDFEKGPVCAPLRNMVYIGPEGVILPCQSMLSAPVFNKYPNLFETPLREILSDSTYIKDVCSNVSSILEHNQKCRDCEFAANCCGGCRAMAIGANGDDFYATDENTCHFYKDGWYKIFRETCDAEMQRFKDNGGLQSCRNRLAAKKKQAVEIPEC